MIWIVIFLLVLTCLGLYYEVGRLNKITATLLKNIYDSNSSIFKVSAACQSILASMSKEQMEKTNEEWLKIIGTEKNEQ